MTGWKARHSLWQLILVEMFALRLLILGVYSGPRLHLGRRCQINLRCLFMQVVFLTAYSPPKID